jgi:hypothetical protein
MKKMGVVGLMATLAGLAAVVPSARADLSSSMECHFRETRGGGGGGGAGGASTCRAWVNPDRDTSELRVRCSGGFRLRDENAHHFDHQGHEFTVGSHDDRVAVLRVHRNTRDPEGRMRAMLITSSDPYSGYLSDNDRYRGFCRMP